MIKSTTVPCKTKFFDTNLKCNMSHNIPQFLLWLSHDHNSDFVYKWEYLSQEPDVDLESSGDVLMLSPVSRKDSGIYQCRPLDSDGYTDVKGEMQLTVHCEERPHKHTYTQKNISTSVYNITCWWTRLSPVLMLSYANHILTPALEATRHQININHLVSNTKNKASEHRKTCFCNHQVHFSQLGISCVLICSCWLFSDLDPAVVVPKDSEVMLKGEDLTATCNALSSLKTSTVWYKVH